MAIYRLSKRGATPKGEDGGPVERDWHGAPKKHAEAARKGWRRRRRHAGKKATGAKKTTAKATGAKKTTAKATGAKKTTAKKTTAKKASGAKKATAKKTTAKKTTAKKTTAKKTTAKATGAKKTTAKATGAKKTTAKKATAKKATAKKATAKKATAKKTTAKKTTAKKATAKATAKKATAKKATAKKATAKKATAKKPAKPARPPRPRLTEEEKAQRREARTRAELERVAALEKATKKLPKGKRKKVVGEAREAFEEKRVERTLVTEDAARGTKKEREESKESFFDTQRRRARRLLLRAKDLGQLPKRPGRLPRKVDTKTMSGEQVLVTIDRWVAPETVEGIRYKVDQAARKLSGDHSIWYVKLILSGLGEKLFGSNPTLLTLPEGEEDPDAKYFQTEGYETSIWNSLVGALEWLDSKLESYAHAPNTVAYLHQVHVINFDRKEAE